MRKALIVDDSRTMRSILRRMMTEMGHEVREAGNGREAIEAIEDEASTVTLVLADWNMPEMNGFELLQYLRDRDEYSSVKIVMVTTEAEIDHMTSALAAGADEYMMKPFTKDILREKLQFIGVLPEGIAS